MVLHIALSSSDLSEFTLGSKLQLVAWYSYTALIWSLKGTMLCFFARLTVGTWHSMIVKGISIVCVLSYVAVFLTVRLSGEPLSRIANMLPLDHVRLFPDTKKLAVRSLSIQMALSQLTENVGCFQILEVGTLYLYNGQATHTSTEKCTLKMQNFLVTTVLNVL